MSSPVKQVKLQAEVTPAKAQEVLEPDASTKVHRNQKDASDVWWSCPRCLYTISDSLSVPVRNGRKCFHILGHGTKSQTARSRNYKLRSRMLRAVWEGRLKYTPGKLTKKDLTLNKKGRVVPKRRSAHSKKICQQNGWAESIRRWTRACNAVRAQHGITGFMKLKKNGSAMEKKLYMQVVEATSQELVNNLNHTLQQIGSENDKQTKITSFTATHIKSSPPRSPPALAQAGA